MTDMIRRLVSLCDEPTSRARPYGTIADALGLADAGALGQLLTLKNGFFGFEDSLHVFSAEEVVAWNQYTLWRYAYENMTDGCTFFAEDVFGGQFCMRERKICTFDPETGDVETFANDMNEWARKVLSDVSLFTGCSLAQQWRSLNGRLPKQSRLVPKIPFVLGGAFSVENLYALERAESMRYRGSIAIQIRDVPDGSSVKLRVVD